MAEEIDANVIVEHNNMQITLQTRVITFMSLLKINIHNPYAHLAQPGGKVSVGSR